MALSRTDEVTRNEAGYVPSFFLSMSLRTSSPFVKCDQDILSHTLSDTLSLTLTHTRTYTRSLHQHNIHHFLFLSFLQGHDHRLSLSCRRDLLTAGKHTAHVACQGKCNRKGSYSPTSFAMQVLAIWLPPEQVVWKTENFVYSPRANIRSPVSNKRFYPQCLRCTTRLTLSYKDWGWSTFIK